MNRLLSVTALVVFAGVPVLTQGGGGAQQVQ